MIRLSILFITLLLIAASCVTQTEPVEYDPEHLWDLYGGEDGIIEKTLIPSTGCMLYDEGSFYFHNSSDNQSRLYRISDDGDLLAVSGVLGRHAIGPELTVIGDKLYTSVPRKGLLCLDKSSLEVIWLVPSVSLVGNIISTDGKTLFHMTTPETEALDPETGTRLWTVEIDGVVPGSCPVDDSTLYISTLTSHRDGYLYYVDKNNGNIRKKIVLPFIEENDAQFGGSYRAGITISSNLVFVGCNNRYVYAFDKKNGNKKWEYLTDAPVSVPLTLSDSVIYTGTLNGSVYAIRTNDGKLKWKHYDGVSFLSKPSIYDNKLFISHSGLLVFNTGNGNLLLKKSWSEETPYDYYDFVIGDNKKMFVSSITYPSPGKNLKYLFRLFNLR